MSEIWLYKAIGNDVLGGVATTPNIFGRDAFSFWAPLDQKFLEVMTKFAQSKGIEYISPFWTKYLFAYLDYETHKNKSAGELLSTGDIESVKNIMAKKFSDTGLKYKEIIQSN